MATAVTREFMVVSAPYPAVLPGSSPTTIETVRTGINNVVNYNITNSGIPLYDYVEINGPYDGNILNIGVKIPDDGKLPETLSILHTTLRTVFQPRMLNIYPPWYNPKAFIFEGSSVISTAEYVGLNPTTTPYTTLWSNAFTLQPNGTTWTRSKLFDTYYGLQIQSIVAPHLTPSFCLQLASLTVAVTFELPSITPVTTVATEIYRTRVNFNGTVDPQGATSTYPLTVWFQYNKTGTFATTDPITGTRTITGTGSTNVSIRKTGLDAGAIYYYRMVVRNGAGDLFYGNPYLVQLPLYDAVLLEF